MSVNQSPHGCVSRTANSLATAQTFGKLKGMQVGLADAPLIRFVEDTCMQARAIEQHGCVACA